MATRTYYNSGNAGRSWSHLIVGQHHGRVGGVVSIEIGSDDTITSRSLILSRDQAEDLGTQLLLAAGVELEEDKAADIQPMIEGESFTLAIFDE